MATCTCHPHYAGKEKPADNADAVGWAVEPTEILLFNPGCPAHEPPGEDDPYSFETPPAPRLPAVMHVA